MKHLAPSALCLAVLIAGGSAQASTFIPGLDDEVTVVEQPALSKSRSVRANGGLAHTDTIHQLPRDLSMLNTDPHAVGGALAIFDKPGFRVELKVTEKATGRNLDMVNSPANGAADFYVIVASARNDAPIGVQAAEAVAACTGRLPHIGRTQPSQGGFSTPAYAIYFGPYGSRTEAIDQRAAVSPCVADAYVGKGVIQRY